MIVMELPEGFDIVRGGFKDDGVLSQPHSVGIGACIVMNNKYGMGKIGWELFFFHGPSHHKGQKNGVDIFLLLNRRTHNGCGMFGFFIELGEADTNKNGRFPCFADKIDITANQQYKEQAKKNFR